MTRPVLVCLLISVVLRILIGYVQKDIWKIKTYKYFILIPLLTVIGTIGSKVASFIAYADFGGTRLYGTILAIGIFDVVLAYIFGIPFKELYGFSSVGTWLSVAIMKVPCIIQHCCAGRVLYTLNSGRMILFPSQIVETVIAALFFIWFFKLAKSEYPHAAMYPLMMVWYGIYRYAVDWMRGTPLEQSPFVFWIPAGRFFSLLILGIGLLSLYMVIKKSEGKKPTIQIYSKYLIGKSN